MPAVPGPAPHVIAPQAAAVSGGKVVIMGENHPRSISFLVTGMDPSSVNFKISDGSAASRPSINSFCLLFFIDTLPLCKFIRQWFHFRFEFSSSLGGPEGHPLDHLALGEERDENHGGHDAHAGRRERAPQTFLGGKKAENGDRHGLRSITRQDNGI